MLPNLLVRYAVISQEWVSMPVYDPSHPSMPLYLCILYRRTLVRIDGQPEGLNFLERHFLAWLSRGRLLGLIERDKGCIDELLGKDRGGLMVLQSTKV